MRQIIILTLFLSLLVSACSDNNSLTEDKSISNKIVKEDVKIPINKTDYVNYLAFKSSDTSYVFDEIRRGDKHFGSKAIKEYSIDYFKKNDWTILKLDTTFSLLFYHSLIYWLDGDGHYFKRPNPAIGISLHNTDKKNNYSFVVGNYYQREDTEVGLFDNGTTFFIYVPNAWEEKGNIYTSEDLTLKEKNLNEFFKTYTFPYDTDTLAKLNFARVIIRVK
jgi:hypothetical protein